MADPQRPRLSSSDASLCLSAAVRIATRLIKSAEWRGDSCNWIVNSVDQAARPARRVVLKPAGPALYQGTAGIALFLAELSAQTLEREFFTLAEGALNHSLSNIAMLDAFPFGFHSGHVGVAYAMARFGVVSGKTEFIEHAVSIVEDLFGTEHNERGNDVICGAAGAIPALLVMSSWLECPSMVGSALRLGDRLIDVARRRSHGWSWSSIVASNARDLAGLAHGAAGCASALLELYAQSGKEIYRYAAEQGFAYERSLFSEQEQNWLDFRNVGLDEALATPIGRDSLQNRLREGSQPPSYQQRSTVAWCHGAAGICLTRLRAYDILGSQGFADEARVAAETVARATPQFSNYSLCHGVFGNDAALLVAGEKFRNLGWLTAAVGRALRGIERYEDGNQPWPAGTTNNSADPSLMLGDAGIGLYLLSLAVDSWPEVLFPRLVTPVVKAASQKSTLAVQLAEDLVPTPTREDLQVDYVNEFFARSLYVLERLLPGRVAACCRLEAITVAEPRTIYAVIQKIIHEEQYADIYPFLIEAVQPELCRFELLDSIGDYADTLFDDLSRRPLPDVDWSRERVVIGNWTRLFSERYDWDSWWSDLDLRVPRQHTAVRGVLLHRRSDTCGVHRLRPFAYAVLDAFRQPSIIGEAADRLQTAQFVDGDRQKTIDAVSRQVERAYEVGILCLAKGN